MWPTRNQGRLRRTIGENIGDHGCAGSPVDPWVTQAAAGKPIPGSRLGRINLAVSGGRRWRGHPEPSQILSRPIATALVFDVVRGFLVPPAAMAKQFGVARSSVYRLLGQASPLG